MMTIEPPSAISTPAVRRTRIAPIRPAIAMALLMLLSGCGAGSSPAVTPINPASQWILTWSDEFTGVTGSAPDATKWTNDNSGDAYNAELETYTSRPSNIQQTNGNLVITALKEDTARSDGSKRHYTSGRIKTQELFSQTYGRFEASIKLPLGRGIWPAFWMLGNDIDTASWPTCGEIDILENIGEPATVYSSLHSKGFDTSDHFVLPVGQSVNTAFHLYAVEWAPNDIKFFVDDQLISERTPTHLAAGSSWAFDHPFFIVLNLAVGGTWPGSPDQTTAWPQQMLVDYVRVYKKTV